MASKNMTGKFLLFAPTRLTSQTQNLQREIRLGPNGMERALVAGARRPVKSGSASPSAGRSGGGMRERERHARLVKVVTPVDGGGNASAGGGAAS